MKTFIFLLFYITEVLGDLCFNGKTGNTFLCQSRCCRDQCCVAYDDYRESGGDEIAGAVIGTLLGGTILVLVIIYFVRNYCHHKRQASQVRSGGTIAIICTDQVTNNPVRSSDMNLSQMPPSYEESMASSSGKIRYSQFENEA